MRIYSTLVLLFALLVAGCGGGSGNAEAPAAEAPAPEAPMQAANANSNVQEIVIRPVGDTMEYETTEFTVTAGTTVRLVMENTATLEAMQHNVVVLAQDADVNAVGIAGMQAGPDNDYVPESDAVLFATAIAAPGETTTVEFTAPPPGDYPYVCTFPGHYVLMRGVMHSVE